MISRDIPVNEKIKLAEISLDIESLKAHYQQSDFTPAELMAALVVARDSVSDNPIWIRALTLEEISSYLSYLEGKSVDDLPLFGIPFAIKDNIDLAGIPTTAACPDFTYTPSKNATVVEQLIQAGAIPLGKTNLDQFATGLVGTRSPDPWGACKNAFDEKIISGGSSSGSAVALALGLVSFSLGTDTAGSGRVPASLNNLVGLKPSRGLISCSGVVPACRSLDCVSIFALTTNDANAVFDVAVAYDEKDAYSRRNVYANSKRYFTDKPSAYKLGVPSKKDLAFFENDEAADLFDKALEEFKAVGAELVELDFSPFLDAARLLYEGPWVAERYLATQEILDAKPEALLPVTRKIIEGGKLGTASEAFDATYKLQACKQLADKQLAQVDAIITPTIGTFYSIEQVAEDPIALNSNLGYYTNFMNLLDYAAVAVPTGFYNSGLPFGVTLFGHAFLDKYLLSLATIFTDSKALPLGAYQTVENSVKKVPQKSASGLEPTRFIDVAVCGAHLEGFPLNWQLRERGAELLEVTKTSAFYRFYALAGGPPKRPGLVRVNELGESIDVEVWRMPYENFGSFVAEIPAPLGIGKVELDGGRWVSGFICDHYGLCGASEITEFRSWKAYIESLS